MRQEEMAHLVKCLPQNNEYVNLEPHHTHKKLELVHMSVTLL